uniref:TauD/TfdA family dioxygenase n=1 Tax=Cupriavidus necator TaxID=106590 RepID=UPI003F4989D3
MNDPHPSAGLPDPLPNIAGANAWYGPDLAARCDWMHQLDPVDVAEIDAAIDHALACRIERVALTAADFPLPRLAPRLQRIRADILHGRGVALLRGWPAGERGFERNALAFLGIGAHLGEFVSQNGKGHVLGHVANLGLNYADPTTRGYQTRAELRYHVDGGDIVGLLCMHPARSGGLSKIASSTAVWNEIARRSPDLARELLWPFAFSRWGEIGQGSKPYFEMPVFQLCAGRMIPLYILSAIEKAQAFEVVPRLGERRWEALRLVDAIADEPGVRLDMDFRAGDMQFLSNHSVLHSRTGYRDWPDPGRRRHLLRLWLASSDGPALPESFTTDFQGRTANGRPNGIRVPGVPLVAPLQPA